MIRKNLINKNAIELNISNSKKYKIKTISNSIIYTKKKEINYYLPKFYNIVL